MPGQESEDPPEDDHLREIDLFAMDGSAREVLYRAWDLPPTEEEEELDVENEQGRREMSFSFNRMRAFEPETAFGTCSPMVALRGRGFHGLPDQVDRHGWIRSGDH